MNEHVYFFDTTLRDGEQSPGATMHLQEKLRLARQLEVLGVDIMEAGFPASSHGDFAAVRAIAEQARHIQVAALARCKSADIDRCWEALRPAREPRLHVFIPTSALHMQYKLCKDPQTVLDMAVAGVRHCARYTDNVEFSAEDFSRSEPDFLCRIIEATIRAGASTINLADTVGYAQPEEFAALVRYVMEHTPNSHRAIFSVHCHNDLGLSVANTLAALRAGARQAEVTLNGIGERAGNAALEEVVMALTVRKAYYGLSHQIQTEQIYPSSRLLAMTVGQPIPSNKAIVGANAFVHESGIHQDGMLKNPRTYEIMTPQTVGRAESRLVIGKHSGRSAVRDAFQRMGYSLTEGQLDLLVAAVKHLADHKKTLCDADLLALVQEEVQRTGQHVHLRHVSVQTSDDNGMLPTASLVLDVDGEEKRGAGFGVGPVDALFRLMGQLVGRQLELEHCSLSSSGSGSDAPAEVTVQLRGEGRSAVGRGRHHDCLVAAAKACVDALNQLLRQVDEDRLRPSV